MVDISNFTVAKILDERPSPSGVEYGCELEPLWLAADLIEKAKMERVHIQNYTNDLIQANRLGTLRERKEEAFINVSMLSWRLSISAPRPI
jgi:hypothetical protein